jgi:hypothetical protein
LPNPGVLDVVVDGADHLETQIGPGESGDRHVRVDHAQLPDDVLLHVRGGGCGESENGGTSEAFGDTAEGQVVGPEIVSPLTDAVGLVDDEHADGPRQQPLEEIAVLEALGGEIQDLTLATFHLLVQLARFRRRQVRVHRQRVDANGVHLVQLVLHQGDEGTDDDRQAREQNGW